MFFSANDTIVYLGKETENDFKKALFHFSFAEETKS